MKNVILSKVNKAHCLRFWTLFLQIIFLMSIILVTNAQIAQAQHTFAYIANVNSNSVSVINLNTNTVETTIPVGQNPFGIACSFDGRHVYVTNAHSNSVSVINTISNTVEKTIPVGNTPVEMVFSPDGKYLYVTHAFSDNVYLIDTQTNTVINTITAYLGNSDTSSGIDITPDGDYLYVVNSDSSVSGIVVIDLSTNTPIKEIVVGDGATGISINPTGTKAYVCNSFDNTISVLDLNTNTVLKTLDLSNGVKNGPTFVEITPDNKAWVTYSLSGEIGVFDVTTDMLVTDFPVGMGPTGIAFSPCNKYTYITNTLLNKVLCISSDTFSEIKRIDVGNNPRGINICTVPVDAPETYKIYVIGEERTDNVSRLRKYGHQVTYGGPDLNTLATVDLNGYDQIWVTSYRDIAGENATNRLVSFIKSGGRAFFMGENYRSDQSAYANWRDNLLNRLGAGGVKQSEITSPTQSIYYPDLTKRINVEPNIVCKIHHLSLGNGSFENIGNGNAIVTTEPYGAGYPVALTFDFSEMIEASESRAVVYLNSNMGRGWDLYVENIAEYLGAKGVIPIEISTKDGFGAPGDTGKVFIELKNNQDVAGVQFSMEDVDNYLTAVDIKSTLRTTGFNLDFVEQSDGTAKVLIYNTSGDIIQKGEGSIAELDFVVSSSAPLGSSTDLLFTNVVISDPSSKSLYPKTINGKFQFSYKKGDVNFDGVVDILDIVKISNIILGRPPAPTSEELISSDFNNDSNVDVLDIIGVVNEILGSGLLKPDVLAYTANQNATFWLSQDYDNQVSLHGTLPSPVAGLQLSLNLDNSSIKSVTPITSEYSSNMKILTNIKNNQLNVLVYRLDGEAIPVNSDKLLELKFNCSVSKGIEINNVILGDSKAKPINVIIKSAEILSNSTPFDFVLFQNHPNPFNPTTQIRYYVPEMSHVSIKVFNILGQEIKTLVNKNLESGYHTLLWNGEDEVGKKVGSGVYIYQLNAGNFIESKKMILIQ